MHACGQLSLHQRRAALASADFARGRVGDAMQGQACLAALRSSGPLQSIRCACCAGTRLAGLRNDAAHGAFTSSSACTSPHLAGALREGSSGQAVAWVQAAIYLGLEGGGGSGTIRSWSRFAAWVPCGFYHTSGEPNAHVLPPSSVPAACHSFKPPLALPSSPPRVYATPAHWRGTPCSYGHAA